MKPDEGAAGRPQRVSHLFQIQLLETHLTREQADRLASIIRERTTKELLKMDFRMQELAPLFKGGAHAGSCEGCGGACHQ